jgi:fibronectin type 3 domain-containing protein
MKSRTSLLESSLKILSLAATALLIGCAGVSSRTTETATGTGPTASTHTVNLAWNASTSPDISGYNIYRAIYTNSCISFSKINSALNTSTSYTDSKLVNGTSYCYAITAVNVSNEESGYSNIVSNVQIPAS